MNCNEVRDKLPMYMDNECSEKEKKLIEEHLDDCRECTNEYTVYRNILNTLKEIPDEEPPIGYCKRLREKLLKVKKYAKKPSRFKWAKYGSIAAAVVLVCVYGMTVMMGPLLNENKSGALRDTPYGVSTESASRTPQAPSSAPQIFDSDRKTEMAMDNQMPAQETTVGGDTGVKAGRAAFSASSKQKELKVIKSGDLVTQTEEYDAFLNDVVATVTSYEGYVQQNNTDVVQVYSDKKLKQGYLEVRVPQEKFYEFVDYVESNSSINQKNITETDVTKQYYDKYNQVENLEIQEANLRKLFEKADAMADILQIENEIRRIRTEIDALNIDLRDIDDRTSMATVTIQIEEVLTANIKITDRETVWQRSKDGYIYTVNVIVGLVENIAVILISLIPILIPVILVVCILIWIRKRRNRN